MDKKPRIKKQKKTTYSHAYLRTTVHEFAAIEGKGPAYTDEYTVEKRSSANRSLSVTEGSSFITPLQCRNAENCETDARDSCRYKLQNTHYRSIITPSFSFSGSSKGRLCSRSSMVTLLDSLPGTMHCFR